MKQSLCRTAHSLGGQLSPAFRGYRVPRGTVQQLAALSSLSSKCVNSTPNRPLCKETTKTVIREYSSQPPSDSAAPTKPSKPKPTIVKLEQDNLFHPFSKSPIPEFRQRAAYMRQHAFCPHPDHKAARLYYLPGGLEPPSGDQPPAHVDFECPDCGIPVYCSEAHWMDDYEEHLKKCDLFRQMNEDEHDLRSGREFPEIELPGFQVEEFPVNMTGWDVYMWTREYFAVNAERGMRQATRMLTYPLTIASILHELSPYSLKNGRLTVEGLRSFSALRFNLHHGKKGCAVNIHRSYIKAPAIRIFVLGARAESSLPREFWRELTALLPECQLHIIMIGPESMANRDQEFPLPERAPHNPFGAIIEVVPPAMKISTIVDYYHTIHKTGYFSPHDPYLDCFVLFHPGLGHPSSSHEWESTLPLLLETKVPIISTGYTPVDLERDVEWVQKKTGGEFDILIEPGENIFRSLRWDISDRDPQDISCGNWGVWAFRGKRYDTTTKDNNDD